MAFDKAPEWLGAIIFAELLAPPGQAQAIPLIVKVLYTAFIAILVPAYCRYYGPSNFLWFSDLALLITLPALWLESPFLAGMQAVSVGLLEVAWLVDFLAGLLCGINLIGLSRYMFKPEIPLAIRGLSLFHVGLPVLLLWLVWRLGYDPRAWMAQTVLAWAVLLVCYFFIEPSRNINWVFGPGEKPQTRMPAGLYLLVLMLFMPGCVYFPTHLLLQAIFPSGARP